ncbi:hypothetical protein BS78_04G123200 [Paspalum vaginatum]|nr:hypothetical protein BS78_04G123200 [Paspalum vaginatum]
MEPKTKDAWKNMAIHAILLVARRRSAAHLRQDSSKSRNNLDARVVDRRLQRRTRPTAGICSAGPF